MNFTERYGILPIPSFVKEQQKADVEALITEERLNSEESRKYLSNTFRDNQIKMSETDIDKIMPLVFRFGGGASDEKKQAMIDKLKAFLENYYGCVGIRLSKEDT